MSKPFDDSKAVFTDRDVKFYVSILFKECFSEDKELILFDSENREYYGFLSGTLLVWNILKDCPSSYLEILERIFEDSTRDEKEEKNIIESISLLLEIKAIKYE